jgi:hypothetical protein
MAADGATRRVEGSSEEAGTADSADTVARGAGPGIAAGGGASTAAAGEGPASNGRIRAGGVSVTLATALAIGGLVLTDSVTLLGDEARAARSTTAGRGATGEDALTTSERLAAVREGCRSGTGTWAGGVVDWAGDVVDWAGDVVDWAGDVVDWAGGVVDWAGGVVDTVGAVGAVDAV